MFIINYFLVSPLLLANICEDDKGHETLSLIFDHVIRLQPTKGIQLTGDRLTFFGWKFYALRGGGDNVPTIIRGIEIPYYIDQ